MFTDFNLLLIGFQFLESEEVLIPSFEVKFILGAGEVISILQMLFFPAFFHVLLYLKLEEVISCLIYV